MQTHLGIIFIYGIALSFGLGSLLSYKRYQRKLNEFKEKWTKTMIDRPGSVYYVPPSPTGTLSEPRYSILYNAYGQPTTVILDGLEFKRVSESTERIASE